MSDTDVAVSEAPAQTAAAAPAAERVERVTVIRPAPRWPHLDVGELWHYRELLLTFVWRDIKVRYKQTLIGVVWALLVPVLTAVVYTVVFGRFAKFPSGNLPYPLLAFSGILPMQYFTSALTQASGSLVQNVALVTKVYFPRVLLPMSGVLVPFVDFVIGFAVLLGLMGWFGIWPAGPAVLLALPFVLVALATALGLGLGLAALNVRYRDVPYAIPVFLQVLPFLSAVPYAFHQIPEKWQWVLAANPMTAVITGWRWAVLDGAAPDPAKLGISLAVAAGLFLLGLTFFRRSEPRFADTI